MYELNLLFLLSSVSFAFSLGTVSLIKFLKTKKHWISPTQYVILLSVISGLVGGNLFLMYNYLYENAELIVYTSLDSFMFIPVASYVMITISLCYFTSYMSCVLKTESPPKAIPQKTVRQRNTNTCGLLDSKNPEFERSWKENDMLSEFWNLTNKPNINPSYLDTRSCNI